MASPFHIPVMLKEAVDSLDCKPSGIYVDGTLGGGGHAFEILKRTAPGGKLIGMDADEQALAEAARKLEPFGERKTLVRSNFSLLRQVLADLKIHRVNGILLDLGVSSYQLNTAERGFSFTLDAPLDMRMDRRCPLSAYELVNESPEKELARIIRDYGEERMARRIARSIAVRRRVRPIRTTAELAELIVKAMPPDMRHSRIHPATRTFQAIRIAVNDELANLKKTLEDGIDLLLPGGRFSVISFHSLEDRIVKDTFRSWEVGCICSKDIPRCICGRAPKVKVLTRRPKSPGDEELSRNPRARSAKLRTAERI